MSRLVGLIFSSVASLSAALLFVAGIAGCGGPDIEGICLAQEDCLGGNEADIAACQVVYEAQVEIADIEGCEEELEVYLLCFYDTADCQSVDTGVQCDSSKDCRDQGFVSCSDGSCRDKFFAIEDADDCETEASALERCL